MNIEFIDDWDLRNVQSMTAESGKWLACKTFILGVKTTMLLVFWEIMSAWASGRTDWLLTLTSIQSAEKRDQQEDDRTTVCVITFLKRQRFTCHLKMTELDNKTRPRKHIPWLCSPVYLLSTSCSARLLHTHWKLSQKKTTATHVSINVEHARCKPHQWCCCVFTWRNITRCYHAFSIRYTEI